MQLEQATSRDCQRGLHTRENWKNREMERRLKSHRSISCFDHAAVFSVSLYYSDSSLFWCDLIQPAYNVNILHYALAMFYVRLSCQYITCLCKRDTGDKLNSDWLNRTRDYRCYGKLCTPVKIVSLYGAVEMRGCCKGEIGVQHRGGRLVGVQVRVKLSSRERGRTH